MYYILRKVLAFLTYREISHIYFLEDQTPDGRPGGARRKPCIHQRTDSKGQSPRSTRPSAVTCSCQWLSHVSAPELNLGRRHPHGQCQSITGRGHPSHRTAGLEESLHHEIAHLGYVCRLVAALSDARAS